MPVSGNSGYVSFGTQVLQLVALHLLFAALGFCHSSRAAAIAVEPAQGNLRGASEEAKEGAAASEAPLLGEAQFPVALPV
jgi:hypothetical protein